VHGIIQVCLTFNLKPRREDHIPKKYFTPNPTLMRPLRSGPLANHLNGFAELLVQQGYGSYAGWKKIRLAADLNRWLVRQCREIGALDEQQAPAFLEARHGGAQTASWENDRGLMGNGRAGGAPLN
jgi:hypothetical protein